MPDAGTFHDLGPQTIPGLQGGRRVQVFVPPGRADRQPALFLWDGQNVFGDEGSFAGGWHAHEAMERRAARRRRAAVVVSIDHGNEHRIGDYAPVATTRFGEGRAPRLLDWVVAELVPRIRRDFPVLGGAENTLIGGSSMGGLISLFATLRHPDVFGRALVMSPSLFFGGEELRRLAAQRRHDHLRVYLDGGAKEMNGALARELPKVARTLEGAGVRPKEIRVRVDPRGRHSELDWRRRLPRALDFLLRRD